MRFYQTQHQFYCGIDLHARLLAICIVDQAGNVVLRAQILADKQVLLDTLAPYRPNVVVGVECLFAWYWVADLCAKEAANKRNLWDLLPVRKQRDPAMLPCVTVPDLAGLIEPAARSAGRTTTSCRPRR